MSAVASGTRKTYRDGVRSLIKELEELLKDKRTVVLGVESAISHHSAFIDHGGLIEPFGMITREPTGRSTLTFKIDIHRTAKPVKKKAALKIGIRPKKASKKRKAK